MGGNVALRKAMVTHCSGKTKNETLKEAKHYNSALSVHCLICRISGGGRGTKLRHGPRALELRFKAIFCVHYP